jgi:hypothetical protein
MSSPGGDIDESASVERRLPRTPIYENGGPFKGPVPRYQPPKALRDMLYDRMCDWRGHTVAEMESWQELSGNRWVSAMIDLIAFGFAFDRETAISGAKLLRLRKREPHEEKQLVVDVLSGMTLPDRIVTSIDPGAVIPVSEGARSYRQSQADEESRVYAENDQWAPPPEGERMVLDASGDIVLSAPEISTESVGILARKGAGKTYLGMVLAEEFLASTYDIPFVVLDPMGVWWGLLANADGTPLSGRLVAMGGARGHYPLDSRSGRSIAEVVVEARPMSFLFDMSGFEREEQQRFCKDLAAGLFRTNKEPLHVFVDEADIFAPQRLEKSRFQKQSLTEIDNLVRRGRTRGLGTTLITQRPAVISKNTLTQVGAMFFLQTSAPHDLNAIDTWLHDQFGLDVRQQCRAELPALGKGQAFYMRGGEQYRLCKFTVRAKRTFDSSYTPSVKDKPRVAETCQLADSDRAMLDDLLSRVRQNGAEERGTAIPEGGAGDAPDENEDLADTASGGDDPAEADEESSEPGDYRSIADDEADDPEPEGDDPVDGDGPGVGGEAGDDDEGSR